MSYIYTFLQSNILEWCIYLPFLRLVFPDWKWSERALLITAMNAVTHPIVFFFIMSFPLSYLSNILIAETFAVVAEALVLCYILRGRTPRLKLDACLASFIANLISWQIAPMITYAVFSK